MKPSDTTNVKEIKSRDSYLLTKTETTKQMNSRLKSVEFAHPKRTEWMIFIDFIHGISIRWISGSLDVLAPQLPELSNLHQLRLHSQHLQRPVEGMEWWSSWRLSIRSGDIKNVIIKFVSQSCNGLRPIWPNDSFGSWKWWYPQVIQYWVSANL